MDIELNGNFCICVEALYAQKMRHHLECQGVWDERFRLIKISSPDGRNEIAIPVLEQMIDVIQQEVLNTGQICSIPCRITRANLPPSKKLTLLTPRQQLVKNLKSLIAGAAVNWTHELEDDIPKQWEIHGDLVLLPDTSFQRATWDQIERNSLWEIVARCVNAVRVAKKGVVKPNDFRSPQVHLLLGDTGWVEQIDNGIKYTYDIQHCMFSSGNITEKLRVARLDCKGETVVDLYAGIGYFTLPYLVHARAAMVHACEWNPHAVRALEKNLHINNVRDRCVIHAGDNSKVCPKGVADRVNLGLIPSSEKGWPVSCAALKPHAGGILHIHANVTTTPRKRMEDSTPHNYKACQNLTANTDGNRKLDEENIFKWNFQSEIELLTPANEMEESGGQPQNCNNTEPLTSVHLAGDSRTVKDDTRLSSVTHNAPPSANVSIRTQWTDWANDAAKVIQRILSELHDGRDWNVHVIHVEHVKSYAPHVDHIVADLECRPKSRSMEV